MNSVNGEVDGGNKQTNLREFITFQNSNSGDGDDVVKVTSDVNIVNSSEIQKVLYTIVLAAGKGTRMKTSTPKVLHKLCGKTLLERVLDTTIALRTAMTILVVKNDAREIIAHPSVAPKIQDVAHQIHLSYQNELDGTGAAVSSGMETLTSIINSTNLSNQQIKTVLILSGDVPLIEVNTLKNMYQQHLATQSAVTILSTTLPNPYGYGRIVRNNNQVCTITEETDADAETKLISEVNTGIYLFDADVLCKFLPKLTVNNISHEVYLTDIIELIVKAQLAVQTVPIASEDVAQTEGVNTLSQLAKLSQVYNSQVLERHMDAGVTIIDPNSTWIDDTVTIENDVVIEPNCYITGKTIIKQGSNILLGSRINSAEIRQKSLVGPYAYLRPNTVLHETSKVGTFVETKNVQIGKNTKVPHLSYVGDATIGDNTNIGAGTIFANYDGVNKHTSSVGNNTLIGSKTILVAPVKVGDDVYTGAATLVRQDVTSGSLSYSTNVQVEIVDWVKQNREKS